MKMKQKAKIGIFTPEKNEHIENRTPSYILPIKSP